MQSHIRHAYATNPRKSLDGPSPNRLFVGTEVLLGDPKPGEIALKCYQAWTTYVDYYGDSYPETLSQKVGHSVTVSSARHTD